MDLNLSIDDILKIGAAYGILQVLAQDLGIKTGKKQRDIVQSIPIQIFLMYSGGYAVTGDHKTALIATVLYYILKYIVSNGETSGVCFEDV
jgi:hypothetical protein|tara:strand:- start:1002 stop:1274 length:273 start_codon:yes stop_codon:yes gene_type:complete